MTGRYRHESNVAATCFCHFVLPSGRLVKF